MPDVERLWRRGATTGGATRNAAYLEPLVDWGHANAWIRAVLVDPQTSGGLLVAVPADRTAEYLSRVDGAVEIGEVAPPGERSIVVV
jgi:selenide,water dikinase